MCLRPLHIKKHLVSGVIRELTVPCGICPDCLKKRQSAIVVRSYIESCKNSKVCMFTLTYNDNHLPYTEDGEVTLRREDIKNWKKDFRKIISNKEFSWICSGEYSPRGFHRPHYHGIFFGLDKNDLAIIEDCWSKKYGFTVFKQVPCVSHKDLLNVSRYISKYVIKDEEFKQPSPDVESPRIMTSIGFGYPDERFWNYVLCFDEFIYDPFDAETVTLEIATSVCDRLYFPIDGFRYSVPQYAIRKKLYYFDSAKVLRPSPLYEMVSFVKKFRSKRLSFEEFQAFHANNSERTLYQNLVAFDLYKEVSDVEKSVTKRADIISNYKKSLI